MLSDERSSNKDQSASYAPDSVLDTEDTMNNPAIPLQRIYPKEIKIQAYSSIQAALFITQKEKVDITKLSIYRSQMKQMMGQ